MDPADDAFALGLRELVTADQFFESLLDPGKAPIHRTPAGTKSEQDRTKTTSGDIIARWLVEGPQITGQSQAKLKQVSAVVAEGYEEGLTEDQLPRRYHEPQKHYFGELKKFVEAVEQTTKEPADAATEDESPSDD